MAAEARSVVVRLSLDTAQAIRNSQQFGAEMGRTMDQAERSTKRAGDSLDALGEKAGKVGALAAVGLGVVGKSAMDWESQWAGVEKTVDGTASQMAQLEGELRGLAKTLPATHAEIAATAEAAGQLGVAREDIAEFTETMIALGETTNLSADEAATSIAQMANVMGTAPQDVERLGAALVALGNDGASTEREILGMAQRISAAGAQIGLTEANVLAIANAAVSMGVEVEAGGSAVSRVFTEMAKATKQGGADLESFAQVAGVSTQEFVRAFEEDPAQAFAAFTSGLDRINQSGGDVFSTLEQLGLSDIRVSQALLSMAASGDMLTDSLQLGNEAWAENTALMEEAEKRYGTTASEARVAMNQVKDAAIEVGNAVLPAIGEIAEVVGKAADAFGSLPAPVHKSLAGLAGVAAIVGGGTWFTLKAINAVSETRAQIRGLATDSPRASRALGGLAKAAGAAAALMALGEAITFVEDKVSGSLPSVSELEGRLLQLNEGMVRDLGSDFAGLGDAVNNLDAGGLSGVTNDLAGLANQGGAMGSLAKGLFTVSDTLSGQAFSGGGLRAAAQDMREQSEMVTRLDEALTAMVSNGGPEQAQEAFRRLAESQSLSSSEQSKLLDMLPGYSDALQNTANSAVYEGEAAKEAAAGNTELSAAVKEAREAAIKGAESFLGLGESLNDSKVSLGDWIGQLEEQARALRNFTDNMVTLSKRGINEGLLASLQQAGTEGALRMEQLANATDAELKRANQAWRSGQGAMDEYGATVDKINERMSKLDAKKIKPDVEPARNSLAALLGVTEDVNAGLDETGRKKPKPKVDASSVAAAYQRAVGLNAALDAATRDRSVTISINAAMNPLAAMLNPAALLARAGADGMTVRRYDAGGTVAGPRLPYRDKVFSFLAPGEEVVSNRYGQADRHRGLLKAINANSFADGGTPGRPTSMASLGAALAFSAFRPGQTPEQMLAALSASTVMFAGSLEQAVAQARLSAMSMGELKRAVKESEKAIEREKAKRDDLRSRMDSIASSFDRFKSQVFGLTASTSAGSKPEGVSDADWAQVQAFHQAAAGRNAGADMQVRLQSDIANGQLLEQLAKQLGRKGFDGIALQALLEQGSLEEIQRLAGMSRGELRGLERLYEQREQVFSSAGRAGGEAAWGKAMRGTEARLDSLVASNRQLERRVEALVRTQQDENPRKTGRAVADALNDVSADGIRKQGAR